MLTNRDRVSNAIRLLVPYDNDYLDIVWSIEEFNKKFDVSPNPKLYAELVIEEIDEWQEELLMYGWTPNLLKETADIIYVLEGLLSANPDDELDIDHDTDGRLDNALKYLETIISPFVKEYYKTKTVAKAFEETHRSNLSKLGEDGKPIRRDDNKVLKGPNYTPADMSELVETKESMAMIFRF